MFVICNLQKNITWRTKLAMRCMRHIKHSDRRKRIQTCSGKTGNEGTCCGGLGVDERIILFSMCWAQLAQHKVERRFLVNTVINFRVQ
jgi:hypothetical protein